MLRVSFLCIVSMVRTARVVIPTARPLGGKVFVIKMSSIAGRELGRKKSGPKRNEDN